MGGWGVPPPPPAVHGHSKIFLVRAMGHVVMTTTPIYPRDRGRRVPENCVNWMAHEDGPHAAGTHASGQTGLHVKMEASDGEVRVVLQRGVHRVVLVGDQHFEGHVVDEVQQGRGVLCQSVLMRGRPGGWATAGTPTRRTRRVGKGAVPPRPASEEFDRHEGRAVGKRFQEGRGWGAMRQRILGSHTPPCHRRVVSTTLSSMFCLAALQRKPDQCRGQGGGWGWGWGVGMTRWCIVLGAGGPQLVRCGPAT